MHLGCVASLGMCDIMILAPCFQIGLVRSMFLQRSCSNRFFVLQRLIEMRSDEAERTRGIRTKKEKKRADKEMTRLQAQYVHASIAQKMHHPQPRRVALSNSTSLYLLNTC